MRVVRVNELVKRELSEVLHTRYQGETVYITISEVRVAPNLRNAEVFYDVLGGPEQITKARRFFARERDEIRKQLSKRVVLKYLPHLQFTHDDSLARGNDLNQLMDEMGLEGDIPPPSGTGFEPDSNEDRDDEL